MRDRLSRDSRTSARLIGIETKSSRFEPMPSFIFAALFYASELMAQWHQPFPALVMYRFVFSFLLFAAFLLIAQRIKATVECSPPLVWRVIEEAQVDARAVVVKKVSSLCLLFIVLPFRSVGRSTGAPATSLCRFQSLNDKNLRERAHTGLFSSTLSNPPLPD